MHAYINILKAVLDNGTLKENRTGVDTISMFNYNYDITMLDGFPLITTRKLFWKPILIENLWFLGRSASPAFFHKHMVKFWDQWIEEDGNLPEAYGKFWREYPNVETCEDYPDGYTVGVSFDQFEAIVENLKRDPNNRRLVLTNWYPPSAWSAKLPPCHLMAIFNTQYKKGQPYLNLHLTQRSCDVPVGVPFNIAGYAFILELVSHLTGIPADRFGHTLVDAHIYMDQMPGVQTQVFRDPRHLPKLTISKDIRTLADVDEIIRDATTDQILDAFKVEGYNPHPGIKYPVAV